MLTSLLAAAITCLQPLPTRTLLSREADDRAAVEVRSGNRTLLSWRWLESDDSKTTFEIVRRSPSGSREVIGRLMPGSATCFEDRHAASGASYQVVAKVNGKVVRTDPVRGRADDARLPYLSIPLKPLTGYSPNDASVGDLDGDGSLDIVVHRMGRSHDNSQAGVTDPPVLDAYRLDGSFMWRINLGRNIREGAHYTQFLVEDFDGDGRAEVACKTADGTVDGQGRVIGDRQADHRNRDGYILRGPEFLTVFDGRTGRALDTQPYDPPRHPERQDPSAEQLKEVWGDGYGNRVDRFLACAAYLDGTHPSLVFSRGYYTRTVLAAWDFDGKRLKKRWVFDSAKPGNEAFGGNGNHNLSVADVDGDGRDEIVFGSMTVDDDGTGLYSTGLGHGDALHVSDLNPDRPGLEVFAIHEHSRTKTGISFRDARTGEVLWQRPSADVGRGVALDIDPRYPGAECWAGLAEGPSGLISASGRQITARQPKECNFGIFWDGDPQSEILDKNTIWKWDYRTETESALLTAVGADSGNGTKATPSLCADILGDWREEVIFRSQDDSELRIYSTPIPTSIRMLPLMRDRQYRQAVVWQNVGYNQPPHPSFDMATLVKRSNPTLWVIGDSTVRNGSGDGANAQWGWGDLIAPHFDTGRISIVNRAIGGRSSRTFRTEGRWDAILAEAKPGDFVLMQFGHNDPGAINDDSRARGSIRGIGEETEEIENLLTKKHEVVHTFGWYLRSYVREAKSHGLTPIVCSYVPRCPRPGSPLDPNASPESYRLWSAQVAGEESAIYIDLYGLIAHQYAHLTPEEVKASYFTSADFTHTNQSGAALNARMVVRGIGLDKLNPLRKFLRSQLPGTSTAPAPAVRAANDQSGR